MKNTAHKANTSIKRGRPVGSFAPITKAAINIRLDPVVLHAFKATGRGWQTRINALLLEAVQQGRVGT